MSRTISRRRFIGISAAAAGLALLPFGRGARAAASAVVWQGRALGAVATLQIHHRDRAAAEGLIQQAVTELDRLERLFSLYRGDSALVELNRRGVLNAPAQEMVALLDEARRISALTGGAFDPTVQPLWTLYATHFGKPDAAPEGPEAAEVETALSRIGLGHVLVSRDRVAFARRDMALTLNGIAQGYITDRIVALLREGGIEHSHVDMGEHGLIGARPDGGPWRVGIADPDRPQAVAATLEVVDQAVATSGGYGLRFDAQGRFNHLFDPRTGLSAKLYKSVTVIHPSAMAADALSTAFSLMPLDEITRALKTSGLGKAHIAALDGERLAVAS